MPSVPLNTRRELRRRTSEWLSNLCFQVLAALFDDSLNTLPVTFPFLLGAVRKSFQVSTEDGRVTTLVVSLEFKGTTADYVSWQIKSDIDGAVLAKLKIPRAILDAPSCGVNISAVLVLTALRHSVAAGRSICLQREITYQPVDPAHDSHRAMQQLQPVEEFWLRVSPPLAGPNPDEFDMLVTERKLQSCSFARCDTLVPQEGEGLCSTHLSAGR